MSISESALPQFDSLFTRELPGDSETGNFVRQVTGACYSKVEPTAVRQPKVLAVSRDVAARLGFSSEFVDSPEFAQVFAGNQLLPGMDPHAMCYGGHQFGHWAGQLGDGRAINLGDRVGPDGQRLVLQLKGAGPTPYSRSADGRAVLRSSLREYVCSEAMESLGIPTTRALSLVLTGDEVMRDMLYDGNPRNELGAVVCRVAPSFLRFGNYQIFAARNDNETLKTLLDFTIRHHFPQLAEQTFDSDGDRYLAWLTEVCRSTAELVVHWMRVGFVHGVLNTDNMSILGLTIDYGPYGWLDNFDPNFTPNTTDARESRYRYGWQPQIALWNLAQLAQSILPLVDDTKGLEAGLDSFREIYESGYQAMLDQKLGVDADDELVDGLFGVLQATEVDYTIFFRRLGSITREQLSDADPKLAVDALRIAYYDEDQLKGDVLDGLNAWLGLYRQRLDNTSASDDLRRDSMNRVNPKYIPRNYLAQQAIDLVEAGDASFLGRLLTALENPYDEQPEYEDLAAKRPDWARNKPGCSMLSCSS